MPFTPYHFGPSGFVGLALRKYIDVPVFVLANVIVDIEVLLYPRWPVHKYAHTLLIGALVGAIWGLVVYIAKPALKWAMRLVRVPYKAGFWKMIISGILGVWFHVVIDAIYHWDVKVFWPSMAKPLYGLVSRPQVKIICIAFFFAVLIPYAIAVVSYLKNNQVKKSVKKPS